MNTMYRNNIGDKRDDKTGYQKVQDAIAFQSDDILASNNIGVRNSSLNQLISTVDNKEDVVMEKLYGLAKDMQGMPWAVDRKSDLNKILECLGKAPKALLHVHSTVGLSVHKLGDLIDSWNNNLSHEEGLKIYYATVTPAGHKVPIHNVLMYKQQFDTMKAKGVASNEVLADAEWFNKHLNDFCISEPRDIETNWKKFGTVFSRTDHLFKNRDFYKEYHTRFFEECLEDNISYVELRTGFEEFNIPNKKEEIENGIVFLRPGFRIEAYFEHADAMTAPEPTNPNADFLKAILEAKDAAVKNWKEKGMTLEVKVILTANRNKTMRNMQNTCDKIDAAISMKNGIGSGGEDVAKMIVGFDFVDREERTWGLTDELHGIVYGEFLGAIQPTELKLKKLKEKRRIQLIRLFFHGGESTDIISDRGNNAVTGPICSRHRIGHGFQMGTAENLDPGTDLYGKHIMHYILNGYKGDVDVQNNYPIEKGDGQYKRWDYITEPVIELCPISNYMLGYVKDLKEHPAISLMENGILAVICNDDPQLFGSKGLSHDYAMMYTALIKCFEDRSDTIKETEKWKAYEYIKTSSFLGYFYQEMSGAYYVEKDGITVANDDLTLEEEGRIFERATGKFKEAWSQFIKLSA